MDMRLLPEATSMCISKKGSEIMVVNKQDTRQKLEADVHRYANPNGDTGTLGDCWEQKMLEFLDRQEMITERKIVKQWEEEASKLVCLVNELKAKLCNIEEHADNQRARLSELELLYIGVKAQRDAMQEKIDKLIIERDKWKAKAEGQESLAGRASADYLHKLDEYDELEQECNKLREELKDVYNARSLLINTNDKLRNRIHRLKANCAVLQAKLQCAEKYCECKDTTRWVFPGATMYYQHKLSCGHVSMSVEVEPPNYCEICGAKVQKEGDQ